MIHTWRRRGRGRRRNAFIMRHNTFNMALCIWHSYTGMTDKLTNTHTLTGRHSHSYTSRHTGCQSPEWARQLNQRENQRQIGVHPTGDCPQKSICNNSNKTNTTKMVNFDLKWKSFSQYLKLSWNCWKVVEKREENLRHEFRKTEARNNYKYCLQFALRGFHFGIKVQYIHTYIQIYFVLEPNWFV